MSFLSPWSRWALGLFVTTASFPALTARAVNIATTAVAAQHVALNRSAFFDPVVALQLAADGSVICSGVLIAPNKVLTAASCLIGPDGQDASDPSLISVGQFSSGTNALVGSFTVISATRHPSWTGPDGDNIGVDLAVLELAEPMTGVTPARLASTILGTEGAFAGFGIQGTGLVTDLPLPGAGARVAAMNRLSDLSTVPGDVLSHYWITDFDSAVEDLDSDGDPTPIPLEGGLGDADAGTGLWVRTGPGPEDWALGGILAAHGNELGESGGFGDLGIWTRLDSVSNREFINTQAIPEPGCAALLAAAAVLGSRRRSGTRRGVLL